MSGIQKCSSCKKNVNLNDFIIDEKILKTCITCRVRKSEQRKKDICEDCGIRAIFNFGNFKFGIKCSAHKQIGMVNLNVKAQTCEYVGCETTPTYNFEGETKGRFCTKHKQIGMINIKAKKCEYVGCKTIPSYNFVGETKGRFCNTHREIEMINVTGKMCEHIGCKTIPSYHFEGETKGGFCFDHKKIGMINVKSKTCEHVGCKTQPSYNFEGETKGRFCTEHKEIDMINVKDIQCENIGCYTQPNFNFEGETKGRFCTEHKETGMINVKSKKCEHVGCKTQPSYNFEGETKVRFCAEHKEIDMIDIKTIKCEHIGCKTEPTYNIEGETKGRFCNEHKENCMIDVKNKICKHVGCKTRASFGFINQLAFYCAQHKLPLMFMKRKVECNEENCFEISEYGIEEPTHCYIHQKDNHLCLLGQKCKKCDRENELCNKEQICLTYCRPTELSIIAKKIIKKKEGLVLSYLDKNIKTDIKPIDDKIIDISCVKRRPDRVYDCGSYFTVVEIDENQHKSYSNGCVFDVKKQELRRMVQIHEALSNGMMPVIFIRFNPDNFRVKGNLQKINMQKRLDILCKWLNYCLNIKEIDDDRQIQIKHLFYDEYEENNIEFEYIEDVDKLL